LIKKCIDKPLEEKVVNDGMCQKKKFLLDQVIDIQNQKVASKVTYWPFIANFEDTTVLNQNLSSARILLHQ
jgi:hypothetical protein